MMGIWSIFSSFVTRRQQMHTNHMINKASLRRVGVILDPIAKLKPAKDTSLALMEKALALGFDVFVFHPSALYLKQDQVWGIGYPLALLDLTKPDWYQLGPIQDLHLSDLDLVLMRQDPPFNMNYIYTTYLLELLEKSGNPILKKK
jgi:glutathione synthase